MNMKSLKIFMIMSRFLKTRSPVQCRSHFQKIKRNYKSFTSLIEEEVKKFKAKAFRFVDQVYEEELDRMNKSNYNMALFNTMIKRKGEENPASTEQENFEEKKKVQEFKTAPDEELSLNEREKLAILKL